MSIPEHLVDQFRQTAIERLDRVEAAWSKLLTTLDVEAATLIDREIHTLKGESRVVGFTDVNLIAHKLEDMIAVARSRGYAVDDELDLAITMALRFTAMLVRKRTGGVDLPGFVRQIDNILSQHDHAARNRPGSVPPMLRTATQARVSAALREHLGPAALDAFVEYAVASGPRRDRLRGSWHLLRDLIAIQRAVLSAAQLDKYNASVASLAAELGKQVSVALEAEPAEVTSEVLAAVDIATLHLVRNAVDHGVELPAARTAVGKPAHGTIRVRSSLRDNQLVLVVEDDGRGIDFAQVCRRAIELGLIPDSATVDRDRLVELMCHPGFSTRSEANEISGRGVGLDAVRGSAVDLGGSVTAVSEHGRGTTWTVAIPVPVLAARGHVIRAPGLRFPVVVAPTWRPLDRAPELPIVVDLGGALGLAPSNSISASIWWFTDGALEVGLLCGGRPTPVDARRLVHTPATSIAEVVTVDGVEGLLLRPNRIPGVG